MTITARFMIEKPEDIECTMKITMTVREWVALRDELKSSYPSWKLSHAIDSLVTDARKTYYPPEGDKDALA